MEEEKRQITYQNHQNNKKGIITNIAKQKPPVSAGKPNFKSKA